MAREREYNRQMIARALVAIFLMMNLCVAVWWAAGGEPARAHAPPALAADAEPLTLLAEAPARVAPVEAGITAQAGADADTGSDDPDTQNATGLEAAARTTESADAMSPRTSPAGDARCFSLGPFREHDDLARVSTALSAKVRRQQVRETEISEANGYQVLLPAFRDRGAAFAAAKALQTAGIRDYYVITAGEQQNAISLGLFRDLGNAERRHDSVRAIGFDARLLPRQQQRRQWWLDIAVGESDEWRAAIGEPDGWQVAALECE